MKVWKAYVTSKQVASSLQKCAEQLLKELVLLPREMEAQFAPDGVFAAAFDLKEKLGHESRENKIKLAL